jgi:hypothetical protein
VCAAGMQCAAGLLVMATAHAAKERSLAGRSRACRQECHSHATDRQKETNFMVVAKVLLTTHYMGSQQYIACKRLDVEQRRSRRSGLRCWQAMVCKARVCRSFGASWLQKGTQWGVPLARH